MFRSIFLWSDDGQGFGKVTVTNLAINNPQDTSSREEDDSLRGWEIALIVVFSVIACICCLCGVGWWMKRRKEPLKVHENMRDSTPPSSHRFGKGDGYDYVQLGDDPGKQRTNE